MDNSGAVVFEKARKYESIVYAVMWLLVLFLPFVNEFMRMAHQYPFSWCNVIRWLIGIIPYILIFVLNNNFLVPRYLFSGRVKTYLLMISVAVVFFVAVQYVTYDMRISAFHEKVEQRIEPAPAQAVARTKHTFVGVPMPIILNLSLVLMLLGANTAIIFIFRYVSEKQIREALENVRLQDEIRFLKAQINPHFFMNVLNNIHAMIELEPQKAQDMTIELSKLMRYVLYDGDNTTTSLCDEINFIRSYVNMFRRRYPVSRVEIIMETPEYNDRDFVVSPLIFVSFVENAFKHGISYQVKSVVKISFSMVGDKVRFVCMNTLPPVAQAEKNANGIGMDNVKRRLDLLYGDRYELNIDRSANTYNVELILPSL